MSVKTVIPVYTGNLDSGLSIFPLPTMQGYSQGVLLVRVTSKSSDGTLSLVLGEYEDDSVTDAFVVAETLIPATSTYQEWRAVVDLPALRYAVVPYLNASSASVVITFIAS